MRKWIWPAAAVAVLTAAVAMLTSWYFERERREQERFDKEETELIVSNTEKASIRLFQTGKTLSEVRAVNLFDGLRIWLPKGNYFLRVEQSGGVLFYPVTILGYRAGPDEDGALTITIRPYPAEFPPRLLSDLPEFIYIPSGHFVIGDRLNPQEPHYVWLSAYFISPFEVTHSEFKTFLDAQDGYMDESNWTKEGIQWKSEHSTSTTALLGPADKEYKRFGQPDQPVVEVKWHEAHAFCKWLTRRIGNGKWIFTLPSEGEWEKAARGPDSFNYGLGMSISDDEVKLYNWRKNPDAPITVVGIHTSQSLYAANRYGLYHISGNVSEWTQTIDRPYNRNHPYIDDDDRNHDHVRGLRVVRGGSWYSASIAILYVPYRDTFQPEHSSNERGFRLVARRLPNR